MNNQIRNYKDRIRNYKDRIRHYKRDGTPYTGKNALFEWAADLEDIQKRIVKQEKLKNGVFVSTVWLGLDHNYFGNRPLIFESMVFFDDELKNNDGDMWRYSTEEEAHLGHKMLVKKWSVFKTAEQIMAEIKTEGGAP